MHNETLAHGKNVGAELWAWIFESFAADTYSQVLAGSVITMLVAFVIIAVIAWKDN